MIDKNSWRHGFYRRGKDSVQLISSFPNWKETSQGFTFQDKSALKDNFCNIVYSILLPLHLGSDQSTKIILYF